MAGRVYDPIHDTFQDTTVTDTSPPVISQRPVPSSLPVESHDDIDTGESTQSDNEESLHLLNFKPSQIQYDTPVRKIKDTGKYNRHLKKPDGEFFSREDLQFTLLTKLFSDERPIFTNIYKEFYHNAMVPLTNDTNRILNVTDVGYDARKFVFNDKLTFSQIYALTLSTSTKCSKILRDKLLLDPQVAFSTCILSFLVNIGRLNTTINFYLEMTSQLRTFHSVPCLQYGVEDPKSLQDTPRLKSILKNLPLGNQPIFLADLYRGEKTKERFNIVNLIFALCDNVGLINSELFLKYLNFPPEDKNNVNLFRLLDYSDYEPSDRCNILLWLFYIHLETDLTPSAIQESIKLFNQGETGDIALLPLRRAKYMYDVDPRDEYEFGIEQKVKREEFMKFASARKGNCLLYTSRCV